MIEDEIAEDPTREAARHFADASRMVATGLAGLAIRRAHQDRRTARQLHTQTDLALTTRPAQRHQQAGDLDLDR